MSLNRKPLKTDEDEMRLVQTPRKYPLPVPSAGVFDAPYRLILCNVEWWSHVSGMIDVLSALDAWVGDDDEKTRGIREIAKLLSTDWGDMFVEDVRWNDSELLLEQRKNGVYEPVTDFDLLYAVIVDAWEKADNAQSVNAGQDDTILALGDELSGLQTWKTTVVEPKQEEQDDRLDAIETLQATHDASIANLASRMDTAEADIDALEALNTSAQVWSEDFDFTASDGGWSGGNPWSSGDGWLISSAAASISFTGANVDDSRVTFVVLQLRRFVGTSFISTTFTLGGENSQECGVAPVASGSTTEWMQINRITNGYTQEIAFTGVTGLDSFYIEKATFWGRGTNPF